MILPVLYPRTCWRYRQNEVAERLLPLKSGSLEIPENTSLIVGAPDFESNRYRKAVNRAQN
jgi:hypothetical protein